MKMKDEKQKHNHKLTDLLKVCIFGILMIAPLLASVSQMLYVTLNKNAKDSYSGSNQFVNTLTEITNYNEFYEGLTYETHYKPTTEQNINYSTTFYFDSISFDPVDYGYENKTYVAFQNRSDGYLYLVDNNGNISTKQIWGITLSEFSFVYKRRDGTNTLTAYYGSTQFIYVSLQTQKLDNAFYYGVDQMTKSDLFNWTQNTAIYTGIKAMTDNLQIQTPAIAILIVYWFILTIIYVIIDIVLKCFTTITHMIFRAD